MDDEDDPSNEHHATKSPSSVETDGVGRASSRAGSSTRSENDDSVLASQRNEAEPAAETRWKKLHENYSDDYLELFKATYEHVDDSEAFEDSQIGATIWYSAEKSRFFNELQRKGRHHLPELVSAIRTKSVVEIQDYLMRLREAEADRQRFSKEAKNVSHAEIDAAIEIGPDCEAKLEAAADVLSAFQDQYDLAMAQSQEAIGIVDEAMARELDKSSDSQWTEDEQSTDRLPAAAELFHLSTMLELSEHLFMNPATESDHDHWAQLVEAGERPAMTMEAIQDLHRLVISLTQRLLQTSMFIAQSRQRASSSRYFTTRNFLKTSDIKAACDILKLPADSWDYWRNYPRRSGVDVVMDKSQQRARKASFLTLDQVEAALGVRRSLGRKRSLASLTDTSSINDEEEQDSMSARSSEHSLSSQNIDTEHESSEEEYDDVDRAVPNGEADNPTEEESEDAVESPATTSKMENSTNPNKRRRMMEQEEDDYLERLDQAARTQEEARLMEILEGPVVKAESVADIGRRPRAERKTNEELQYWSDHFRGSWWETSEAPNNN